MAIGSKSLCVELEPLEGFRASQPRPNPFLGHWPQERVRISGGGLEKRVSDSPCGCLSVLLSVCVDLAKNITCRLPKLKKLKWHRLAKDRESTASTLPEPMR